MFKRCLQNSGTLSTWRDHEDNIVTIGREFSATIKLVMSQCSIFKKGADYEFKNPDLLFKSIDMSSNHLSEDIPIEIGDLLGLVSLNLSRNNLSGQVTSKIGNLKLLELLDLSRTNHFGKIPSSLAQIDRLSELDVSHNHFRGMIPIGTQLQSFDASSYEENICLCGDPLDEECPEDKIPIALAEDKNEKSAFMEAFYMSMGLGFPVEF